MMWTILGAAWILGAELRVVWSPQKDQSHAPGGDSSPPRSVFNERTNEHIEENHR